MAFDHTRGRIKRILPPPYQQETQPRQYSILSQVYVSGVSVEHEWLMVICLKYASYLEIHIHYDAHTDILGDKEINKSTSNLIWLKN
jgi:hypothetical protein